MACFRLCSEDLVLLAKVGNGAGDRWSGFGVFSGMATYFAVSFQKTKVAV